MSQGSRADSVSSLELVRPDPALCTSHPLIFSKQHCSLQLIFLLLITLSSDRYSCSGAPHSRFSPS